MWFDSEHDVVRIVAVGAAAYLSLLVLLRVSGKRTLAKLNAFDLVVTVALGSTLSTIVLDPGTSWVDGVAALGVLVLSQMLVAFWTTWAPWGRRVVTAEPTVLLRDGEPDEDVMLRQRVSMAEVRQSVRGSGYGDLAEIDTVVLETDGSLSIIPRSQVGDGSALP